MSESKYRKHLLSAARYVTALIKGYKPDGTPEGLKPLNKALVEYAVAVDPWARSVASLMLTDVGRRNDVAWKKHSNEMGVALREQLKSTPMGAVFRELLEEQVVLIKSLPLAAAERAHTLVQEGMLKSTRSSDIAKEILESSNIPVWRAKMIARTEVSRAAVTLTQVRAQNVGSEGYIWRTVGDFDVRPDHKKMNGKYVRWDDPPSFPSEPTLGPYHAGCGPNCRCYPEPVLPEY